MLDASVAEVISKLVSNPKFSDLIRNKINVEVDTSALDQEIENYKIQLRKLYHNKDTILLDMDSLDYEDKHYQRRICLPAFCKIDFVRDWVYNIDNEYRLFSDMFWRKKMEYISIKQASEKWGITKRRIQVLCAEGRIEGATKIGSFWAIPSEAVKPSDMRIKSGKYVKEKE